MPIQFGVTDLPQAALDKLSVVNLRKIGDTDIALSNPRTLLMLQDGVTVDATYGGPWDSEISNAPDGSLLLRPAPTKIATGVKVTSVDGLLIDTGISAQRKVFTQACVFKISEPVNAAIDYALVTMTRNDSRQNITNNAGTFAGAPGVGYSVGPTNLQRLQVFHNSLTTNNATTQRLTGLADDAAGEWIAVLLTMNGGVESGGGRAYVHTLEGYADLSDSVQGGSLIYDFLAGAADAGYNALNGNFLFGITPHGATRDTAGPAGLGELGPCLVAYNFLPTRAEAVEVLRALAKAAITNGVSAVRGYTA